MTSLRQSLPEAFSCLLTATGPPRVLWPVLIVLHQNCQGNRPLREELELNINLIALGWNPQLDANFTVYESQPGGLSVGRIAAEHRQMYQVFTDHGECQAEIAGKMRYLAEGRGDYPAVGDWVVIQESGRDRATIHAILPRKSKFTRKEAGYVTDEQIIAANVDTVFIMTSLNHDLNLRRIERMLIVVWESGANPVIVLSKADLCGDIDEKIARAQAVARGVPIHVVSAERGEGLDALHPYLTTGQTVALLGSSGVGKSTLTNALLGDAVQAVNEIRKGDDRGRHTTTHRELLLLPGGALIIDTPGLRELQLWAADEGMRHTFADVEELLSACQFNNCSHKTEPGCAIQLAIQEGRLAPERFVNYLKLQRELKRIEQKMEGRSRTLERQRGRQHTRFRRDQANRRTDT